MQQIHDLPSSPTILVLKRSETSISLAVKVTTALLLFEPDDIVTSLLRKLASVNLDPMYKISPFFLGNSEFLQGLTIM